MSLDDLVARVRQGRPRAVARAISLVEDAHPAAPALLAALSGDGTATLIVGVTGPPGAGKSTLVDALVALLRSRGQRVGILAVDPSSPFSGGALLGDRIRMHRHALDPDVFVRSMATRGNMGGLARGTADAARVLAAAGYDTVIIETVGVGQDEVDVLQAADVSIVVLVPGAGDDVQALKAGMMEIADVFVVNKADREGADRLAASIDAMLSLPHDDEGGRDGTEAVPRRWRPPVVRTTATTGAGIDEMWAAVERFRAHVAAQDGTRRRTRAPVRPTVDHVGIAVRDATAAVAFFGGQLGLPLTMPEDVETQGVRVQFVGEGDTRLELLEPLGDDTPVGRFLDKRGPGLHHVALVVDDLDARLHALAAAGVRLIDTTPRTGAGGARIAFVHPASTGGVLVELKERK